MRNLEELRAKYNHPKENDKNSKKYCGFDISAIFKEQISQDTCEDKIKVLKGDWDPLKKIELPKIDCSEFPSRNPPVETSTDPSTQNRKSDKSSPEIPIDITEPLSPPKR